MLAAQGGPAQTDQTSAHSQCREGCDPVPGSVREDCGLPGAGGSGLTQQLAHGLRLEGGREGVEGLRA